MTDFKLPITRLSLLHKVINCNDWRQLKRNETLSFSKNLVAPHLNDETCGLHNLGSGHLNISGFINSDLQIIDQTTRSGLMHKEWAMFDGIAEKLKWILTEPPNKPEKSHIIHVAAEWDFNYQHFLVECLPRILWLSEHMHDLENYWITVANAPFITEILENCFPNLNFLPMDQNDVIPITESCFFVSPLFFNFGHQTAYSQHYYKFLRDSHLALWNSSNKTELNFRKKRVFFGRKPKPDYGGRARVLLNEDLLLTIASNYGFEMMYFDDLSMIEKIEMLSNIDIAIMPIGANMMNMLFAPTPIRLGVIVHPNFKNIDWFQHIFKASGSQSDKLETFSSVWSAEEYKTWANAPYEADPEHFKKFIQNLIVQ